MKKSLSARISIITFSMILLCALSAGIFSYISHRADSIDSSALRALDIARSTAAMIDGDQLESIMASNTKNSYWHSTKAMLDDIIAATGVNYLYALDATYSSTVTYFMEGYDAASDNGSELDLGEAEDASIFHEDMFTTLKTGEDTQTAIYPSGEYGMMVSGFAPIRNSANAVVGVVGVDLGVEEVLSVSRMFLTRILIMIVVLCLVLGLVSFKIYGNMVGQPIRALTGVAHAVAEGNIDVPVEVKSNTEMGELARAFSTVVDNTREQAKILDRLAQGDLTQKPVVRGQNDVINKDIARTVDNLNAKFNEIQSMASGVSSGSSQIAEGAQALANGSTEQAAAVEQLSATISQIYSQSEENAKQAMQAFVDTQKAGEFMQQSMDYMGKMTEAMQEINNASQAISQVISVIDSIAFQTNILSLNASVEAARAGQHGKGFAVVAEEVRNLATKSAAAAQETATLIQNSIECVNRGNTIALETSKSLDSVAQLAGRNAAAMNSISEASSRQSAAIAEVNQGIEQISNVVQTNSATAQQSSAASHEMNEQARVLDQIANSFKLMKANQAPGLGDGRRPMGGMLPSGPSSDRTGAPPAIGMGSNKYL